MHLLPSRASATDVDRRLETDSSAGAHLHHGWTQSADPPYIHNVRPSSDGPRLTHANLVSASAYPSDVVQGYPSDQYQYSYVGQEYVAVPDNSTAASSASWSRGQDRHSYGDYPNLSTGSSLYSTPQGICYDSANSYNAHCADLHTAQAQYAGGHYGEYPQAQWDLYAAGVSDVNVHTHSAHAALPDNGRIRHQRGGSVPAELRYCSSPESMSVSDACSYAGMSSHMYDLGPGTAPLPGHAPLGYATYDDLSPSPDPLPASPIYAPQPQTPVALRMRGPAGGEYDVEDHTPPPAHPSSYMHSSSHLRSHTHSHGHHHAQHNDHLFPGVLDIPVVPPPPPAQARTSTVEDSQKKPLTLACFFCRKRKIACGSPPPGRKDRTCNQCERRNLKCVYPQASRRGMRPKLLYDDNLSIPSIPSIPTIVS